MKFIIIAIVSLFLQSCSTLNVADREDEVYKSYYDDGTLKCVGEKSDLDNQFVKYRVGNWIEYYPNGSPKESGTYRIATHSECCTGGPCQISYSYKYGKWTYYYSNGQIKAEGTFQRAKRSYKNSCGSNLQLNCGKVTDSWTFYDVNGKTTQPSESEILKIEEDTFLNEFDMRTL